MGHLRKRKRQRITSFSKTTLHSLMKVESDAQLTLPRKGVMRTRPNRSEAGKSEGHPPLNHRPQSNGVVLTRLLGRLLSVSTGLKGLFPHLLALLQDLRGGLFHLGSRGLVRPSTTAEEEGKPQGESQEQSAGIDDTDNRTGNESAMGENTSRVAVA
jgi:hypothetical protein